MQFSYLLQRSRQFYHKDQQVPHLVFGIDPGETIGYSLFEDGKFNFSDQTEDLNKVLDLIIELKPDVVVYEKYIIYTNKLQQHNLSDVPTLKIIGIIEYICNEHHIKMIGQLATTAKGFVSDTKLKEWKFYKKNNIHGNDACRHICHYLLFSKE
jgi:hypothetical protein